MKALYKNIRDLRKKLKMTQEELAQKTGYSDRSSIAKIEAGKIDLPDSKIQLFADALQTTNLYLRYNGSKDWEYALAFENYLESMGIESYSYVDNMIVKEDEYGRPYDEMPENPHYSYDLNYKNQWITMSGEEYNLFKSQIDSYVNFVLEGRINN